MNTPPIPGEPFSDIEIATIAREQRCTTSDLLRRWIIQQGKSFYVIGQEGRYLKPITKGELAQSLMRDLYRVPGYDRERSPYGIEWYNEKNDVKVRKPVDEILLNHCTVARGVVADMSLQFSRYDEATQTFHEAVCPLADVRPIYHEIVAEWLRLFGGRQAEQLLDWIATVPRIDRPSCALLITGKSGAGKELLAQGLARRWKWSRSPTELGRVIEGFNEDLARCPLVFCDENMPTGRGGKKHALADLRAMIASSSRTLARKFLSNADLVGAIRLILAANNNNLISSNDDMSLEDQEATAVRFLHIKVDERPVEYLKSIGGRAATESWVAGNMIAEHAAWLEKNRDVAHGRRFIVEGDATDIQRQLLIHNKNTSVVLEWIAQFLVRESQNSPAAVVGNGEILVNTTTIANLWNQYITSSFVPTTTRLGSSLRILSLREVRIDWPSPDGKVRETRYQSVNPDFVYEWAKQNQVGDPAAIEKRVRAPVSVEDLKRRAATTGATLPSLPPPSEGGMGLLSTSAQARQ